MPFQVIQAEVGEDVFARAQLPQQHRHRSCPAADSGRPPPFRRPRRSCISTDRHPPSAIAPRSHDQNRDGAPAAGSGFPDGLGAVPARGRSGRIGQPPRRDRTGCGDWSAVRPAPVASAGRPVRDSRQGGCGYSGDRPFRPAVPTRRDAPRHPDGPHPDPYGLAGETATALNRFRPCAFGSGHRDSGSWGDSSPDGERRPRSRADRIRPRPSGPLS